MVGRTYICGFRGGLPAGESAFLVRGGRPEPRRSKEKQRRRKTGRPRRAMAADPPGRDTGSPCAAGEGTKALLRRVNI